MSAGWRHDAVAVADRAIVVGEILAALAGAHATGGVIVGTAATGRRATDLAAMPPASARVAFLNAPGAGHRGVTPALGPWNAFLAAGAGAGTGTVAVIAVYAAVAVVIEGIFAVGLVQPRDDAVRIGAIDQAIAVVVRAVFASRQEAGGLVRIFGLAHLGAIAEHGVLAASPTGEFAVGFARLGAILAASCAAQGRVKGPAGLRLPDRAAAVLVHLAVAVVVELVADVGVAGGHGWGWRAGAGAAVGTDHASWPPEWIDLAAQ